MTCMIPMKWIVETLQTLKKTPVCTTRSLKKNPVCTTRKTSSYNCFWPLSGIRIFCWLSRSRVIEIRQQLPEPLLERSLHCLLESKRNNSFNISYCCWKQLHAMVWPNRQLLINVKQECQSLFNKYFKQRLF